MNELKRIKNAYENLVHKVGDKCGLGELNYAEKKDFEILEKHEKALKTIIDKDVSIGALMELDFKQYNDYAKNIAGIKTLTRKEYNLLKEVLYE